MSHFCSKLIVYNILDSRNFSFLLSDVEGSIKLCEKRLSAGIDVERNSKILKFLLEARDRLLPEM